MKDYFTIKEIAKMYGISTHTIRHYEKLNLIQPERKENNYRLFSEREIYNLNIIRDLKELKVPLKTIKLYLTNRTVENTSRLFKENAEILEAEIISLKKKLSGVKSRLESIERLKTVGNQLNQLTIKKLKKRRVFQRLTEFTDEASFEKEMRKLYGELLDLSELYQVDHVGGIIDGLSSQYEYKGVFVLAGTLISDQLEYGILEKGIYASYYYQGAYENTGKHIEKMLTELRNTPYRVIPPFYEFYLIDFHETNDKKEYLTEIQVRIEKP